MSVYFFHNNYYVHKQILLMSILYNYELLTPTSTAHGFYLYYFSKLEETN